MKKEIQLPPTMTMKLSNKTWPYNLITALIPGHRADGTPIYKIESSVTGEEISINPMAITSIKLIDSRTITNILWDEVEVGKIYYEASDESEQEKPGSLLETLIIYKDEIYMVVILIGALNLSEKQVKLVMDLVKMVKPESIFTPENGYSEDFIDIVLPEENLDYIISENVFIYDRGKSDEIINDFVGEIYMFKIEDDVQV